MAGKIQEGEVSAMAFGGEGIVKSEGLVTFIPFTAIGDRVSYQEVEKKKSFAKGKLLDLLSPSPQRITPLCPYYGVCGGCQLQHVDYPTQLEYKRQWIQDAIYRQAKLTQVAIPEVHPALQRWHYRRKIVLTLKPEGVGYAAGYTAVDKRSLVAVRKCPIFCKEEDPVIEEVQRLSATLSRVSEAEAKAVLIKMDDGRYVLHMHFLELPKNVEDCLSQLIASKNLFASAMASSPKTTIAKGNTDAKLTIDDLTIRYSAQAFIQNHPEQSLQIYRDICAIAKQGKPVNILDLYSGIGISSLMLMRACAPKKIIGVEADVHAVKLAKDNAQSNSLKGIDFICGYVEKVLPSILKQCSFDFAILNPPREGVAKQALDLLIANAPKTVVYISCMPSTLARDLKILCDGPYRLVSIQGYDMFPQTTHVETVAVLTRQEKFPISLKHEA